VHEPRALVAVNPTRGLDVGASRDVLRRLQALREAGAAVLLISTELEEVLEVADRVAVMSAGRMHAIAHPDRERVGTAMLAGAARA
jgi:simple sugar transport system ATP-binding protein